MGTRTRQWFRPFCFGAVLAVLATLAHGPVVAGETIGWVENAKIYPGAIPLHARMDTGAKESSLRGDRIRFFLRNGAAWVHVEVLDRKDRVHVIERPIVRTVRIKRHKGTADERAAIALGICVGSTYKKVEVNVGERAGFNYPLLIGRNFLAGSFVVDSSRTFTSQPTCIVSSRMPKEGR